MNFLLQDIVYDGAFIGCGFFVVVGEPIEMARTPASLERRQAIAMRGPGDGPRTKADQ